MSQPDWMPLLWRQWSPGYDEAEDVRLVEAAIGAPAGKEAFVVEAAGNFLQLEQPEVVARHIVDFVGRA